MSGRRRAPASPPALGRCLRDEHTLRGARGCAAGRRARSPPPPALAIAHLPARASSCLAAAACSCSIDPSILRRPQPLTLAALLLCPPCMDGGAPASSPPGPTAPPCKPHPSALAGGLQSLLRLRPRSCEPRWRHAALTLCAARRLPAAAAGAASTAAGRTGPARIARPPPPGLASQFPQPAAQPWDDRATPRAHSPAPASSGATRFPSLRGEATPSPPRRSPPWPAPHAPRRARCAARRRSPVVLLALGVRHGVLFADDPRDELFARLLHLPGNQHLLRANAGGRWATREGCSHGEREQQTFRGVSAQFL